MAEKQDDLNLPTAVVTRIIKEVLPDGCNVAKEAKLALTRAASVFVLYLTAQANTIATEKNKKTITDKDVMDALEVAEFGSFQDVLTDSLEQYRLAHKNKKERKGNKDDSKAMDEDGEGEADGGDEDDVEDLTMDDDEEEEKA